jgi:hypothetical protein
MTTHVIGKDPRRLVSSAVVFGFNEVSLAAGTACPCRKREPITPQALTVHDGTVTVICPRCHVVIARIALQAIPVEAYDEYDED